MMGGNPGREVAVQYGFAFAAASRPTIQTTWARWSHFEASSSEGWETEDIPNPEFASAACTTCWTPYTDDPSAPATAGQTPTPY